MTWRETVMVGVALGVLVFPHATKAQGIETEECLKAKSDIQALEAALKGIQQEIQEDIKTGRDPAMKYQIRDRWLRELRTLRVIEKANCEPAGKSQEDTRREQRCRQLGDLRNDLRGELAGTQARCNAGTLSAVQCEATKAYIARQLAQVDVQRSANGCPGADPVKDLPSGGGGATSGNTSKPSSATQGGSAKSPEGVVRFPTREGTECLVSWGASGVGTENGWSVEPGQLLRIRLQAPERVERVVTRNPKCGSCNASPTGRPREWGIDLYASNWADQLPGAEVTKPAVSPPPPPPPLGSLPVARGPDYSEFVLEIAAYGRDGREVCKSSTTYRIRKPR